MYSNGRYIQWEDQLTLLLGAVLLAVGAYVPIDRGPVSADIPEILLPLGVAVGLLVLTFYVRHQHLDSEQVEHVVKFGWVGAVAAGAVGGWWVALSLVRELPVERLSDQIVTVWSLGIGVGVLVGVYTIRRQRFELNPDRERVLAETTWTNRSGSNPILEAIVETIAEIEGVDSLEIEPIYDYVDPDIVADLRNQDDSQWQLLFYTDDYEIRISSQGTLTVYDLRCPDGERVPSSESDSSIGGFR